MDIEKSNEGSRLLLKQAVDLEHRVSQLRGQAWRMCFECRPGAVVVHVRTGDIGVVKVDGQGLLLIDHHTNAGVKEWPLELRTAYDLVQDGAEENAG